MHILVSGSIAYDRIMDFPGLFSDHIVPEKIHLFNVSFAVNGMIEKFGGTAGNIAYSLVLFNERPRVFSTIGKDYDNYFQWLTQNGISTDEIRVITDEFTSSAYITTDEAGNQITMFNPGAMKHPSGADLNSVYSPDSIAIVAPGNIHDMVEFSQVYKKRGIPYIFDPGQAISALSREEICTCMQGAAVMIANEYEMEMIARKVQVNRLDLLQMTEAMITTRGEHGSIVLRQDSEVNIPAIEPQQVLDPTGAGDAYRAGLIKGLVDGKDLITAAKMGAVTASYAIEHYGTQEHHFTLKEFRKRFHKIFGA